MKRLRWRWRYFQTINVYLRSLRGCNSEHQKGSWIIEEKELKLSHSNYSYMAKKLLQNVGGVENIVNAENCVTRMRLEIKDISLINEDNIKKTGAKGVVKVNKNNIQIIVGTEVVHVMKEFNALLSESASEGGK